MENKDNKIIGNLAIVLGGILLVPLFYTAIAFLDGFILLKVWRWAIVPIFGFRDIKLIESTALALGGAIICMTKGKSDKDNKEIFVNASVLIIAKMISLGVLYIITRFI